MIVRNLIHRPIAVTMCLIALIAIGCISFKYIPVSLMPDIDKNHVCSGYLYSDSMKLRKGTRVKDISYFSRDPGRVIIIDDNINANEQVMERDAGDG